MKKSDRNLDVIKNFILHITHSSDENDSTKSEYTVAQLYQMAFDYIEEDHVDGKGNPEDHIVTYKTESSFVNEDKDKEHSETVVVVADFGNDGTRTIATFDNIKNIEAVNDFLKVLKDPYSVL